MFYRRVLSTGTARMNSGGTTSRRLPVQNILDDRICMRCVHESNVVRTVRRGSWSRRQPERIHFQPYTKKNTPKQVEMLDDWILFGRTVWGLRLLLDGRCASSLAPVETSSGASMDAHCTALFECPRMGDVAAQMEYRRGCKFKNCKLLGSGSFNPGRG